MIKQDKTGYQFNQECINDVSKGFLEAQSYFNSLYLFVKNCKYF